MIQNMNNNYDAINKIWIKYSFKASDLNWNYEFLGKA